MTVARGTRSKRSVVVTGDVTIDWNLAHAARAEGSGTAWSAEDSTEGYVQPGGAAMLGEVINAAAAKQPGDADSLDVHRIGLPRAALVPDTPGVYHSYVSWSRFKRTAEGGPDTWRVREFLGLDRKRAEPEEGGAWREADRDAPEADLVVLDDAGLGFRNERERWPAALERTGADGPWVLLKMARPVAAGPLWDDLLENHAERLIVMMTVNDLRLTEVQVSRELSWERTAEDLAGELLSNPRVNSLSHCAHVIVSLDTDGALLLSRRATSRRLRGEEKRPRCSLFFDPRMIEGMWGEEHPGGMVGYTTCLAAGVALQLIVTGGAAPLDVERGVRRGLTAMRALHLQGYGRSPADAPAAEQARAELRFPTELVAARLIGEDEEAEEAFAVARVPSPSSSDWTILEAHHPEGLEQIAPAVATRGTEAVLTDVPLGRFGGLVTVDRAEIEGFQSTRALIREYGRARQSQPLSIAVFGPPGSGKSFGVVQVADSLPGAFKKLEFNLSQLGDPVGLHGALHQVRDVGLSGKIPLVFWDEFDSDELAWLRHFLVPMQDGTFQEGEIVHPIGRAIFVFAGGTSHRMEDFSSAAMASVAAKGPDFLSRLKGYVDIIGPNPRGEDPEADPYHLLRRAILLRSILQRKRRSLFESRRSADGSGEQILRIDPGVLRAFLRTRKYAHGARSLESIVAMSVLHGKTSFERSSLPAREQLDMHVDADDFLELAKRHEPDERLLGDLAQATHVRYCERMRMAGTESHPTVVPWEDLPEEIKEQNRDQVRSIPSQLEALGHVLRRARAAPGESASFDEGLIELLAEREHERWLRAKLDAGWRWAEVRNDSGKQHPDMLPWRALEEAERKRRYERQADRVGPGELGEAARDKDRDIARELGETVAAAGYEIVRVREPGVVVGVTGHRIVIDLERLESGVKDALVRIENAFPGEPLTVLTALAEGADRLVAEEVLKRPNARLIVVLPLTASDYETDFASAESRQRFHALLGKAEEVIELPRAESREAAYEAAGTHVLDHCDVLMTIWDGEGAQGQGGTGGAVAEARERGVPIAWVHAGNRRPGTEEPTSLGEEQGTVTFENL